MFQTPAAAAATMAAIPGMQQVRAAPAGEFYQFVIGINKCPFLRTGLNSVFI